MDYIEISSDSDESYYEAKQETFETALSPIVIIKQEGEDDCSADLDQFVEISSDESDSGIDLKRIENFELITNQNEENRSLLIPRIHVSKIPINIGIFESVFKCKKCDDLLRSAADLKDHYRKLHTFRKFGCPSCDMRFHVRLSFKAHFDLKHASISDQMKKYRCNKCPLSFSRKQSLFQHYKSEHNSQKRVVVKQDIGRPDPSGNLVCKVCDKVVKSRNALRSHFDYFHQEGEERRYKCLSCERSFNIKDCLARHLVTHGRIKKEMTSTVPIQTNKKRKRIRFSRPQQSGRIVRQYGNIKKLSCDFCEKVFNSRKACLWHMDKFHENGKVNKYKCDQCPRSFSIHFNYKVHVSMAHKAPISCELCQKTFRYPNNLQLHIDWYHHTTFVGENNFICDLCPEAYQYQTNLQRHKFETHGIKAFKCELCDKEEFSTLSQLRSHEDYIHKSDKEQKGKYSCGHCSISYGSKKSLERHQREIHSIRVEINCEFCDKKFNSWQGHSYHNDFYHQPNVEIKKRYPCQFCPRSFCYLDIFKRHTNIEHLAVKPQQNQRRKRSTGPVTNKSKGNQRMKRSIESNQYDADVGSYHCRRCKKNLISKGSLIIHKDFSHGYVEDGRARKFQCDKCPMSFEIKQNILRHLTSHVQTLTVKVKQVKLPKKNRYEKKDDLVCKYCGIEYFTLTGVRQHEDFIHESLRQEERRYKCSHCSSSFEYKTNLKRHMQKCSLNSTSESAAKDENVSARRSIRFIMKTETEWKDDFELEDFDIKIEKDD